MSQINPLGSFASFTLTTEEQLVGTIFCYEQKLCIQNLISGIAEQKLALVPEANNYASFLQEEAHLAGQLTILRHLLDCSLASEEIVVQRQKDSN